MTDVATDSRPGRGALTDGAALSTSAVITGAVGLVCWLIAAATLPQAAVGASSAFVSGFMLVAGVSQLNVGLGALRWLPQAGRLTGKIVLRAYLLVAGVAAIGSVVFLLLPAGKFVLHVGGPALFVLASVCWALFQLQDYMLAALGKAWWVPMFNGAFGAVRVAALPALGIALGALGVLVSWIAPTAAMMLVAIAAITHLVLRRGPAEPAILPQPPEVLSYLGPTYLAALGTTLLYNSVPLMVVSIHGTAVGATFFVVWTAVNAVDYAINGFVNSLVLRGSRSPAELPAVLRVVAVKLLPVVTAGAVAGALLAPFLLGLFGHAYAAQGTGALRFLLLGMVIRTVVALAVGVRLAAGRGLAAAIVQASSTVLVLSAVLLAPGSTGLVGPAVGFLAAQVVVAAAVGPGLFRMVVTS
ncbi:hypothetical protein [Kutzneria buriramensis]|uniref:O-antigen/teichoic acid export membrane protein n=1 Tax=Kutzneria buriramensis TaxID=1045776 RepID=A0A3E0HCV7_9PSEU|nr:hypothetical protein [Kutzneria buriramensis]REH42569.1 hypothetical protein BCF44_11064 [Kutzneria buriramensis]